MLFIISGTSAAIWLKTNFEPTGHHRPRRSPLPRVCTIPSSSAPFFNSCSVSVFCTAILPRSLQLCQNGGLQFYLHSRKQRTVEWVEDGSRVSFGQKFPGEEGSVRLSVVVMQQLVLLSSKFGSKSLHTFTQSPLKRHSSMRN
jgi:hypothetical protein